MSVPMPAAVVLIVCKTAFAGAPDQNAGYTGHENRKWAYEHSMMVCRRQEVQLHDAAEAQGAAPRPFTQGQCQRAGIMLGAQWDASHQNSVWRFWRVACPVPIIDTRTGDVIAWKMPECGKRDVVRCEMDAEI